MITNDRKDVKLSAWELSWNGKMADQKSIP